jgi:hypothetical protein
LVRIHADGKPLKKSQRASSETPMHLAVYAGTDAQAIVHVHPPMVLAFSISHDSFAPLSYEEKYTIGKVPVIPQDTPTVTKPGAVVEALKYNPIAIISHGTVAIGKTFQAVSLHRPARKTVLCQSIKAVSLGRARWSCTRGSVRSRRRRGVRAVRKLMAALVERQRDSDFRQSGSATNLTTSLTLEMEDTDAADGAICRQRDYRLDWKSDGVFHHGQSEWWNAVFGNRIDAFLATQQGKLKLKRGELAQLSRWYKPFQRAFALWQTIPVQ